jgi:RNA polymerase sigma factor (sigma-70 family)
VNDDGQRSCTPLEEVMSAFDLQPGDVLRVTDRIARDRGVDALSRTHLFRLRRGHMNPHADKILLLVTALRQMTGVMFRASDLFVLEPAGGAGGAWREEAPARLSSAGTSIAHSWRVLVTDDPAPSSNQAFETLYVEYGVLLRAIAMRGFGIPPDDAEALVHDCFVAYLERHTYIRDVKGWLSGTMRNTCRHYLRDRKREAPLGPEHDATVDPAAQAELDSWMRKLTLASVLARLGAKCRETLRGYYLAEEPKDELADRLSTSTGYIDQLLSTCRRRAHELFRKMSSGR